VGDEQHGRRVRAQDLEQEAAQPLRGRLVQRHERLVHQQQRRLDDEGAGERDPARHAERQPGREHRAHVAEAHLAQPLGDLGIAVRIVGEHELQVVLDRQPGQQARLLEHVADARGLGQRDLAAEVGVQPGDQIEQRALAAARGAEQRHEAVRRHLESQILDHQLGRGVADRGKALVPDRDPEALSGASG
jgi:hypothetical protein